MTDLKNNAIDSRREILKQRRLSIERGDRQTNGKIKRILVNLENRGWSRHLIGTPLKLTGLYNRGRKNAQRIEIRRMVLEFSNLPSSLEEFQLLHLSDLHLDCDEGMLESLLNTLVGIQADVCVLTGDYRFKTNGDHHSALEDTLQLVKHLKSISPHICAILGNHDSLAIGEGLEKVGVDLLLNRALPIRKNGEEIWIAGVDDPHYYACHDLELALDQVPSQAFKILLAHSPVIYREACDAGIHLYLCGHTHGGQIRFPFIGALFKNTPTPYRYIDGFWKYKGMSGLTHRGVGSSILPVRFRCPPEIWILELRKK